MHCNNWRNDTYQFDDTRGRYLRYSKYALEFKATKQANTSPLTNKQYRAPPQRVRTTKEWSNIWNWSRSWRRWWQWCWFKFHTQSWMFSISLLQMTTWIWLFLSLIVSCSPLLLWFHSLSSLKGILSLSSHSSGLIVW